jgi:hypothetical protein
MIGNEKTQFKKGNKAAAKWNLEETKELFNEIKKLIDSRDIQYKNDIGVVSNYSYPVVRRALQKHGLYDSLSKLITGVKPNRKCLNKLTDKKRIQNLEYLKNRYHTKLKHDSNYRIRQSISSLLQYHIKNRGANRSKSKSKLDMIDFTMEELRNHLQNHFTKGMCFDNYGKWHIDHIIPCSWFDLSNETQFKQCWDLRNLKPMWGSENTRKCNRYSENTQLNLI